MQTQLRTGRSKSCGDAGNTALEDGKRTTSPGNLKLAHMSSCSEVLSSLEKRMLRGLGRPAGSDPHANKSFVALCLTPLTQNRNAFQKTPRCPRARRLPPGCSERASHKAGAALFSHTWVLNAANTRGCFTCLAVYVPYAL